MSSVGFLFDENINPGLLGALAGIEPGIVMFKAGQEGVPACGTLDSELLRFAEENELILVSFDKRTMPVHLTEHFMSGRHTCGVILIRTEHVPIQSIAEDLCLIWSATSQDEWIDRTEYIPLTV